MHKAVAVAALVLTMLGVSRAQGDDKDADEQKKRDAVIAQFIPADMVARASADPDVYWVRTTSVTGQLDGTGVTYIIAAYANGLDASVRVLRPNGASYIAVATAAPSGMGGQTPDLSLLDLDGDGSSEVIATFAADRGGSRDWAFKWTGSELINITPLKKEGRILTSAWTSTTFVDLDGDGVLEAINAPAGIKAYTDGSTPAERRYRTFRLLDGKFVPGKPLVYAKRLWGVEHGSQESFSVARPDAVYAVIISNGDETHHHRVTRGSVSLNGATIAADKQLPTAASRVETTLKPDNTLGLQITGPKDETFFVAVEIEREPPPSAVQPTTDCVWLFNGAVVAASFGYVNPNVEPTIVIKGPQNYFDDAIDRGQPSMFLPGTHSAAFWVQKGSNTLAWHLNGFDTSTSSETSVCSEPNPLTASTTAIVAHGGR